MRTGDSTSGAEQFKSQLLVEVLDHAETEGQEALLQDAFTDLILEDLESDGLWPDYQISHYAVRGAAVNGWAIDHNLRRLYLAITDFERTDHIGTITRTEIQTMLKRVSGFLNRSRDGRIVVEDHHPIADLVDVAADTSSYDSVAFFVVTHRNAPDFEPEQPDVPGVGAIHCRVWDLETIRRSRVSGQRLDPIRIDFSDLDGGLPCLAADRHDDVQTYLAYVPGRRLAEIYLEYGGRLLERNVRAFLSARGKINRGIRDTIRDEPERFLAYNNGITATAESVTIRSSDSGDQIEQVHDFQIVNGGQTTASLAVANRDGDCELTDVSVQMKLVVVGPELIDQLVPNISRYANRQNNVQESDLSANNEYLRRMDEASRSLWTPATAIGRSTKWYFERARGSYVVDQMSAGRPAAQKRFLAEYPRGQKFGKNEIALYENTWARLPHLVCRGGQKNFVEFMERLPESPDHDAVEWYQARFRELIAKAIIFKSADSIVNREFGGTYKRQVVAYALSYLLDHTGSLPDLNQIWRTQQIEGAFEAAIAEIGQAVKDAIIETSDGQNITEWTKKEQCWVTIRSLEIPFEEFVESTPAPRAPNGTASLRVEGNVALSDAIFAAQGAHIDGRYRRYRRRKWKHLGDTGVRADGQATLHAYAAQMRNSEGVEYVFNVVVDVSNHSITPLDDLDSQRRRHVSDWIERQGYAT